MPGHASRTVRCLLSTYVYLHNLHSLMNPSQQSSASGYQHDGASGPHHDAAAHAQKHTQRRRQTTPPHCGSCSPDTQTPKHPQSAASARPSCRNVSATGVRAFAARGCHFSTGVTTNQRTVVLGYPAWIAGGHAAAAIASHTLYTPTIYCCKYQLHVAASYGKRRTCRSADRYTCPVALLYFVRYCRPLL